MTTICACFDKANGSVIASDTQGADGSGTAYQWGSKLITLRQGVVVGYSGSYLLPMWLSSRGQEFFEQRRSAAGLIKPYMLDKAIKEMWDEWRAYAKAGGHGETSRGDWIVPGSMLVISPWWIGYCQSDGSVLTVLDYAAIGSGEDVALGSLYATRRWASGVRRCEMAIRAAIAHDIQTGGEVMVGRALDPTLERT